ncbi:MAG: hypothetical protein M1818_007824 [Claussenomyces sp. TS43310]|nr:MAG: hypothetical protein M1818_007824 [Claussenomyces sp. TS43310]
MEPWDQPLGGADQACKECRRRKAKCDRGMPTCGLCARYGRHCLYEKHSKTPLTRKHLTEVEERLERAERLLRQARLRPAVSPITRGFQGIEGIEASLGRTSPSLRCLDPAIDDDIHSENPLDGPPSVTDDFEWDERHVPAGEASDFHTVSVAWDAKETDEIANTIDGMASLTMNETEGGYLGAASGAALLRLINPTASESTSRRKASNLRHEGLSSDGTRPLPLYEQPDPSRLILDNMIDSYFRTFHLSYPLVHEPTFRAQYSEVIERPNSRCWLVLAYTIAAMGVFNSSTTGHSADAALFAQAKSLLSMSFLESGNLTLVQALTLMANYLQKRNKPNSGYNYLGLAVRMAMGLGLHKEFRGWNIAPLKMETRRRVWWTLAVLDIGATITFSRPLTFPREGVEVALPMNIHDRELTAASHQYPAEANEITTYTSVRFIASFHLATTQIYTRIISKPFPSAKELIELDDRLIKGWHATLPPFFQEDASIPSQHALAHAVMMGRYRNLRIIMYRPFVIRQALSTREGGGADNPSRSSHAVQAYERCLDEARRTIASFQAFRCAHQPSKMSAWYSLYFLFQAVLIPCICLRHAPTSAHAPDWRRQITTTLLLLADLSPMQPSGRRCHDVLSGLCAPHLHDHHRDPPPDDDPTPRRSHSSSSPPAAAAPRLDAILSMLDAAAPGGPAPPLGSADDNDVAMLVDNDAWMEFLQQDVE